MNKNNYNQLLLINKIMCVVSYLFLIALIFMITIPWLCPQSEIGKFLLSLQDFSAVMDRTHNNINDFMLSITPISRILGLIGSMFASLPLLLATIIMIKISGNYKKYQVFDIKNAILYSRLGYVYLVGALLLLPLYEIFFYAAVTINNPHGQRFIAFSIGIENITAVFFAIALVTIGQVMKLGYKISEEQQLTI